MNLFSENLKIKKQGFGKLHSQQKIWLYMPSGHFLMNYCSREMGSSKMPADDVTSAEVSLFTHV